ncbi:hypothetical protein ABEB36_000345 [Hypothenemus hampei]|uniref:Transposable element Tc3 transposase n=1 Tax=Hypothenemus hampei TaxID=57062 RepID=A0ABD1E4X5_HYPHA
MLFTDEAWFHMTGYVNSQNMRIWSSTNPHVFVETSLHPQKIGVWSAFSGRKVIGPIFFDGNINGIRYRTDILHPFLEQLHDDELSEGYFQQDGATPHSTRETLNLLQEFYDDRIISRNSNIPWPPRSCDLTPCDFFLWPYIKNRIFTRPVQNMDDLKERITASINHLNNSPEILQNVVTGMKKRINLCYNEQGGPVQHLI